MYFTDYESAKRCFDFLEEELNKSNWKVLDERSLFFHPMAEESPPELVEIAKISLTIWGAKSTRPRYYMNVHVKGDKRYITAMSKVLGQLSVDPSARWVLYGKTLSAEALNPNL